MPWTVFNSYGQRKYLTTYEVDEFVKVARRQCVEIQSFCLIVAYTGCRISEALSLTRENIDFGAQHVIIKCLKKRGKRVFRAVPLPEPLLKLFQTWFKLPRPGGERMWPWSRMTGYRRICEVMQQARISGSYASPKGLRHSFGVRAIQAGIPLTLVQRWLGHADVKTTAIYTSAMGPEERAIAARMWGGKSAWDKSTGTHARHGAKAFHDDEDDFDIHSHKALSSASLIKLARPLTPKHFRPCYTVNLAQYDTRLSTDTLLAKVSQ